MNPELYKKYTSIETVINEKVVTIKKMDIENQLKDHLEIGVFSLKQKLATR